MPKRVSADVLDPQFYELLGEVPESVFDDQLYWSVEWMDRYGREWAIETAHRLGLAAALRATSKTADELASELGFQRGFDRALRWVLEQLVAAGEAVATGRGADRRYRLPAGLRASALAQVREAALEYDANNAPFVELLDLAGATYPEVAAGRAEGDAALLGMGQTALWLRYFDNRNPVYALNNRLAALAAANRLPAAGARVLEVGAGAGSASAALLGELATRGQLAALADYHLTEPAAFLRRKAQRQLTEAFPGVPLRAGDLDIDKPWAEQGVAPGSVDLILGVNVFHVAKDLDRALGEAHQTLAPGGWLVLGECLRPFAGQALPAEMPFQILRAYLEVETHPERRPNPGFLGPEPWLASLGAAGFEEIAVVPDVCRLREIYPRIATGALVARRARRAR